MLQPVLGVIQGVENIFHMEGGREGAFDEIIGYIVVLFAFHKDAVSLLAAPARSSHLLVIMHHGAGTLKMDYKAQIPFIESHSQGGG